MRARYHSAMIITFCGGKGGNGKSTLAVSLAAEWQSRGFRVGLVDADDEQRTAFTWCEVALERELDLVLGTPDVEAMDDALLLKELEVYAADHEITIVDCPGRNGRRVSFALGLSTLAILPCGPTAPQIWAMERSLKQVREVQQARRKHRAPPLDAAILVTQKIANSVIGRQARQALDESEIDVLSTELFYRVTYGEALAAGLGPTTYAPLSMAATELRALARELERRLGITTPTKKRTARAT
jgi:chromosome partitioning protein